MHIHSSNEEYLIFVLLQIDVGAILNGSAASSTGQYAVLFP
jgi:hypothetical protein